MVLAWLNANVIWTVVQPLLVFAAPKFVVIKDWRLVRGLISEILACVVRDVDGALRSYLDLPQNLGSAVDLRIDPIIGDAHYFRWFLSFSLVLP